MSATIYEVTQTELLTPEVTQVFLRNTTGSPLVYEAGQYIKIVHPDQSSSPFSLANAPSQDFSCLELHLLVLKENRRAVDILRQINEKKELLLRGPYGHCTVSQLKPEQPLILIARGTGFSPVKAIIEALSAWPSYPPMHFYWSVPRWQDLYLREEIAAWVKNLRHFYFTPVLTREFSSPDETVKFGDVAQWVLQDYPDLTDHQVYASGPEKMIHAALAAFQERGLERSSFHSDVFDYQP